MKIKDTNQLIVKSVARNKSRIFMTVLASAIGCCFLIIMASFGYGIQESIISTLSRDRTLNQIHLYGVSQPSQEGVSESSGLNEKHIAQLEAIGGVKAVTRRARIAQLPILTLQSYTGPAITTNVVHFPSEKKSGLELHAGRLPQGDNEAIVGYHFLDTFLLNAKEAGKDTDRVVSDLKVENLLGEDIDMQVMQHFEDEETFKSFHLKIVGITATPSREWQVDDSVTISLGLLPEIEEFTKTPLGYVIYENTPEEVLERWAEELQQERSYNQVYVYTERVEDVKDVTAELRDSGYIIYSILDEIEKANFYFLLFKVGLILVGTIAVIIASIGIFNTMTMAVTERSREIGIMKAIGTHPKTIKKMFLLESSYIGLIGALVGLVAAYGISAAVNLSMPTIFELVFNENVPEGFTLSQIPLSLTALSFAICVGVALISGMRPAVKATGIDVLQALRRDM